MQKATTICGWNSTYASPQNNVHQNATTSACTLSSGQEENPSRPGIIAKAGECVLQSEIQAQSIRPKLQPTRTAKPKKAMTC
jgi:hypothetical protein